MTSNQNSKAAPTLAIGEARDRSRRPQISVIALTAIFMFHAAGAEELLHSFPGVQEPDGALAQGMDGNYYGTTHRRGGADLGTVFKMTSAGLVTTVVSFNGANGGHPYAGLTPVLDGALYGTTYEGGSLNRGTVFMVTSNGVLTSLISFDGTNGGFPYAGLTLGGDGNFYGTTFFGGNLALNGGGGYGSIFRMTPAGSLTKLVSFSGSNGGNPYAGLTLGSDGNFYGATSQGGGAGLGTVFAMTPAGVLTTLVSFAGANGGHPYGGLVQGSDGNFYGTTYSGGDLSLNGGYGYGSVFKMTPAGVLTKLVSFNAANGGHPFAGLTQGSDGNFYGTTVWGGDLSIDNGNGFGTTFKITPAGALTTLMAFNGVNGGFPQAGLTQGSDGLFYGATSRGGSDAGGVVFRLDSSQPLSVTQQPDDFSTSLGATTKFRVIALGAAPLAYQWTFNGSDLLNATNSTLSVTNIQLTNAGFYRVVVTNVSLSVTSRMAALQVDPTFARITTGAIVTNVGSASCAAWGDYDNDGYVDLIVTSAFNRSNGASQKNLLFHNNQDGTFTQMLNSTVASEARDWRGCSWVDYDNDGNLDLFVTSTDDNGFASENELFHNNGNGTFTKMTAGSAGPIVAPAAGGSEGPVWADYDRDGFVDVYVARYGPDWLYHNQGDGTFTQVPASALGSLNSDLNSYNAMWCDYDNDGWPDLFVAVTTDVNLTPDQTSFLYHNQQQGAFAPVTQGSIATDAQTAVGCAWGDYNNDGYPDLFVANGWEQPERNALYRNNGDGTFTRMTSDQVGSIASDVGVFAQCLWLDYDNDGYLDLLATDLDMAGIVHLYHNNGDGTFTRITTGSLVNEIGPAIGIACDDYDHDGFLDIFVACGSDAVPARNLLCHNSGNSNAWLRVKLVGTVSNRSAIGAKVRVHATIGGKTFWQMREINTGDGYSAGPLDAHFGLGNATNVDTLRIEWPSGTVQQFTNVAPKQILTVVEPPLLMARISNGAPQFSIKGGRGFQYDIQASADLAAWSSVGTVAITNLSGMAQIIATNPPASDQRFYRAISR
ncbi:MAG TPA: choice-of-anchor tandem repeat GloVer-containing protein [Candidatus Saccharimonadales bacterium]|nr:choice-of-anchor tandem repeat GloVer-containing protein [Candidatus Saccharimonadales bacterium]